MTSTPDRRTVLRGAAAAGALAASSGVLAACGSSSKTATTASPAGTTSSAPAATSSPAETSSAPAAGGALAKTTDIPVGGGTIFKDAKIVVTQPTAGQFKAFTAVCTHKQCIVANVEGGTINCACHGSKYSITDGSVKNPPAPAPLTAVPIKVTGTDIAKA